MLKLSLISTSFNVETFSWNMIEKMFCNLVCEMQVVKLSHHGAVVILPNE
jgi:hypothetical protein